VAQLKKLRRAEGGVKIVGVFRVKNHDFTPKNHIFSNFRDPPLKCTEGAVAKLSQRRQSKQIQTTLMDGNV
jgi:hypothetical protein